jgi:iron(III) transport system substrate-binding protein
MRKLACLGVAAVLVAAAVVGASAQADLVAAAKREGRLVLYGSLTTLDVVNKIFESRYGIPVEYWRAASTRVLDRVLNETRAGRPQFDVVQTNSSPMMVLRAAGAFARYASPSYEVFGRATRDPQALVSPQFLVIPIGIVYNTRLVRPEEAPRSLADLLDPKWKGKVVMADPTLHTTTAQWLMELRRVLGAQWRAFLEQLAGQVGAYVESFIPVADRLVRGEFPVGLTYIRYVYQFGKEGAPLEYVRLPVFLADGHRIALGARATRPNAGKLYIETLLSRAGLLALAQDGDSVSLPGVYPPLRDADKLRIVTMQDYDEEALTRAREELGRIFRRR